MNLINLGLLGVEQGDKSAFFLNLSGNLREEALRDLPALGVEQFEKSSSLIVRLIHVHNYLSYPSKYALCTLANTCTWAGLSQVGAGWASGLPVFGRSVNPISTSGGTLSPPSTTRPPPRFSDLATCLE